jgi:hypothetical protein
VLLYFFAKETIYQRGELTLHVLYLVLMFCNKSISNALFYKSKNTQKWFFSIGEGLPVIHPGERLPRKNNVLSEVCQEKQREERGLGRSKLACEITLGELGPLQ